MQEKYARRLYISYAGRHDVGRKAQQHTHGSKQATYLGKMVKSFSGTSFTLHDYRVTNPNDANAPRHQLATMVYKTNVTGGDPNAFTTIMPRYDEEYLEEEQKQTLIDRLLLLKKKRGSLEQTMLDKLRRKKIWPTVLLSNRKRRN